MAAEAIAQGWAAVYAQEVHWVAHAWEGFEKADEREAHGPWPCSCICRPGRLRHCALNTTAGSKIAMVATSNETAARGSQRRVWGATGGALGKWAWAVEGLATGEDADGRRWTPDEAEVGGQSESPLSYIPDRLPPAASHPSRPPPAGCATDDGGGDGDCSRWVGAGVNVCACPFGTCRTRHRLLWLCPLPSLIPPPMLQIIHRHPHTDVLRLKQPSVLRLPAMSFLNLNNDVLALILTFVSPPDAMRLALTCHDAYSLAMPRFLSDVILGDADPAVISGPDQITLFCQYMLADPPNRIVHLRALAIKDGAFLASARRADGRDTWLEDFSCAPLLSDVLRAAHNLRRLYIRDLEPLLASQPAVADAIAGLTRLRDAHFHIVGKATLELLARTAWRPTRLVFGVWRDGSARVAGDTAAFTAYAPHLRTLQLWQVACLLESLPPGCVCAGVRALGLGGRIPSLGGVAHAFPTVRTLTFAPECSVGDLPAAGAWDALDSVFTSMPVPPLGCAVRRLELRYVLGAPLRRYTAQAVLARTLELIRPSAPTVLACALAPGVDMDVLRTIADAAPRLAHLELVLVADALDGDLGAWVTQHVACFAAVRLQSLSLSAPGPATPELAMRIALAAALAVPSLQWVGVALQPRGAAGFSGGATRGCTHHGLREGGNGESDAERFERPHVWFRVRRMQGPLLERLSSARGEHEHTRLRAAGEVVAE